MKSSRFRASVTVGRGGSDAHPLACLRHTIDPYFQKVNRRAAQVDRANVLVVDLNRASRVVTGGDARLGQQRHGVRVPGLPIVGGKVVAEPLIGSADAPR